MNIEENIKLFQQYQKSNKLEKASEMVDAIAETLKTEGRTVLCANDILELYVFEYYFKTRDYEAVRYPVHRMYHSLAKKYMERMHFDKAYEKLEKAAEWNRVDMDIYWEKTECLKQLGELKKLKETTKELHKFIYTRADIARYYRNIAYYYVEKKEPEKAMMLYTYSNMFSHSKTADSEINFLETALGRECPEYTVEQIQKDVKKIKLPVGISETTLAILFRAGQLELEQGDKASGLECMEVLYQVTGDENIRKIVEGNS